MSDEIKWERHGKTYSQFNPSGAPKPTHPLLPVVGTGTAYWDAQLERWVV